jgi:3-oxoadipate enol-lactonase
MIPVSDTRHEAAWAAAHPAEYDAMLAMASADPYGDEPRAQLGGRLQLEARAAHDTWDRLGGIAAATLICAGRYDGIALPETQERMASRIPKATLRFFEGGHLFMIQDRAAFPAMIEFLQR